MIHGAALRRGVTESFGEALPRFHFLLILSALSAALRERAVDDGDGQSGGVRLVCAREVEFCRVTRCASMEQASDRRSCFRHVNGRSQITRHFRERERKREGERAR